LWINGVLNQVKKGGQTGITGSSGGVLLPFGDLVQKRKDVVRGYGMEFSFIELIAKFRQNEAVGGDAIFF
jgi:hypothetical protein